AVGSTVKHDSFGNLRMSLEQHVHAAQRSAGSGLDFDRTDSSVSLNQIVDLRSAGVLFACPVVQLSIPGNEQLLGDILFREFSAIDREQIFVAQFHIDGEVSEPL